MTVFPFKSHRPHVLQSPISSEPCTLYTMNFESVLATYRRKHNNPHCFQMFANTRSMTKDVSDLTSDFRRFLCTFYINAFMEHVDYTTV
jgi:hypothetical protein